MLELRAYEVPKLRGISCEAAGQFSFKTARWFELSSICMRRSLADVDSCSRGQDRIMESSGFMETPWQRALTTNWTMHCGDMVGEEEEGDRIWMPFGHACMRLITLVFWTRTRGPRIFVFDRRLHVVSAFCSIATSQTSCIMFCTIYKAMKIESAVREMGRLKSSRLYNLNSESCLVWTILLQSSLFQA